MGLLSYFLGIEALYSNDGIILSQKNFVTNLLQSSGWRLQNCSLYQSQGILVQGSNKLVLQAYSESDWGVCLDSRNSEIGYILLLGSTPTCWK